jgi:hypothetical protein
LVIVSLLGPQTSDVAELGEGNSEISVVPFDITGPNVEDFIRRAFRRISIRLVAQLFRDQVLAVTEPNSPRRERLAPSSPTDPRVRQL